MNIEQRKSILTVAIGLLLTTATYGTCKSSDLTPLKPEISSHPIATTDSINPVSGKHMNQPQTSVTPRKQTGEISVGYFSEGGVNVSLTSWTKIGTWFSLGMGFGIRQYFDPSLTLIPIFVDTKIQFSSKDVAPFLSCKGGYSLGGRIFVNPKIGLGIKTSRKSTINIGVGYEMQQIGTAYYGRKTDNSVGASIGFQF